jgi:hypothetical protein
MFYFFKCKDVSTKLPVFVIIFTNTSNACDCVSKTMTTGYISFDLHYSFETIKIIWNCHKLIQKVLEKQKQCNVFKRYNTKTVKSFIYARLETGRIMWLGMEGGRASTQVSTQ